MNTTGRITVTVLALLVATLGTATITSSRRAQAVRVQLQQAQAELQQLKGPHPGGSANDAKWRQRLRDAETNNRVLREELAKLREAGAKDTTAEATTAESVTPTNTPATTDRRAGGPGAWMDRLRQEDPERYRQIVAQQEQRRRQLDEWFDNTIGQLDARAQTAPTQNEADLANQIADTLARLSDLRQQMQAVRELPEDQRQEQMMQLGADMRTTYQQLNTLRDQDRSQQIQALGVQLGLNPDKAQTLSESVPQIYQNTQYTPSRGGGGGGWRGGGPGPQPASGGTGSSTTPTPSR